MRSLPNILTLLNLYAGCLGIFFVYEQRPMAALLCLGLSLTFDFFDGMAARLLHKSGPLGMQLDSLADVVSFGVLPSVMLFDILRGLPEFDSGLLAYVPFSAFALALFGAFRLAKFNIDQRSADHFYGLPIPSAAIFFAGFYWLAHSADCESCNGIFINAYVLLIGLVVVCFLMISDLPHFNLKMKGFIWQGQEMKWIYILLVLTAVIVLEQAAVSSAIVLYILFSLISAPKKVEKS